jgi:hypothetical protein
MLQDTTQDPWKYRVAAFNARLNQNEVCPANHTVNYHNSWYYLDGEPRQAPDITAKAKEYESDPTVEVRFNTTYNSYVLVPVNIRADPPVVIRGSVPV